MTLHTEQPSQQRRRRRHHHHRIQHEYATYLVTAGERDGRRTRLESELRPGVGATTHALQRYVDIPSVLTVPALTSEDPTWSPPSW
ncbi:MAG TPA: hypothetical protein VK875_00025 [Euzebyales bacterium]|nr:hypothetical protein [Euzebyales bacterium]